MKLQFKLFLLFLITPWVMSAQENRTQTVRGQILDEVTRQPLIGAVVLIKTTQPPLGGTTDAEGKFRISKVPAGRHFLSVSFVGYETLNLPELMVTTGKEVILNLQMTEGIRKLAEAKVVYDRKKDPKTTNNEMATVSARSFNPEETLKYAGALGDPSRMAANFAGVIAGNDSRNDIVVRGNSPNAMLWQFEGLNIFNPNHFGNGFNTGGPVSMLNANVLSKSDFFTGAFPAQYGNTNGAVFDLKMREGNNEKLEMIGQVGFNGFEFGAEGPFSKSSNRSSFLISYRYSTLGLMKAIGIPLGTGAAVPLYQDLNYKLNFLIGKTGKLQFFGFGGFSSIDLLGKDVDTTELNFYGSPGINTLPRYRSGVSGVSYEQNLGSKTYGKLVAAISHLSNEYKTDSLLLPSDASFRLSAGQFSDTKLSFVGNITHKFNARLQLHGGFSHDVTRFDYNNSDFYQQGSVDSIRVNRAGTLALSQAYLQLKYRFNERLSFNLGAHAQHLDINQKSVLEPRAGAKFLLNAKSSLNFGFGLHHQNIPTYNLLSRDPFGRETNKSLPFARSQHWVLGYENMLTSQIRIKLEAYYQYHDQIGVTAFPSSFSMVNIGASFAPSDESSLVANGTGKNQGLELTLERNFSQGYYFLLTGSVFDSKYKGSDGIERNSAFNTQYAANFLAGKEFKLDNKGSIFYANIRITSIGGRFITPLKLEESKLMKKAVFDEEKAFSEQIEPYFRADVKIGYKKDFKKATLEFAVDLQNVTNHQNLFQIGFNPEKGVITKQYQLGFFPVPIFRITF